MSSSIVTSLDTLAAWRSALERAVGGFAAMLADAELLDAGGRASVQALRERLAADRLVLAFVAEFSRGKSELINAIFFADAGRRVLPATPGRTTMCPVELYHRPEEPPRLSLLPIDTRLRGLALAELRGRDDGWIHVPLDPKDPEALATALAAVTRTRTATVEEAGALGFWDPENPDDNPVPDAEGRVEVPAWRHALINYPHPLLQRGLVVLDTPGLNAIGAEPELTLSLLPSAHATVFVLAADTGVTRSDLAIWREHLGGEAIQRFVVLNKIDTLADPLASKAEVEAQIAQQVAQTAVTLGLPASRVFPLSARNALAARVAGDRAALAASRMPALEKALAEELLPRRHELLTGAAAAVVRELQAGALRRLADRRRQNAEQMLELRGLRGKSGTKVRLMLQRLEVEAADFERCTARLAALRAVQLRMLRGVMESLSSDSLRIEVSAMQAAIGARPLNLGAKKAFETLCQRLAKALAAAGTQVVEMQQMLDASFLQLNTEFGFAFTLTPPPSLVPFADQLAAIEKNYGRYLTLSQAWRMAAPGFMEQFRRMLVSKLRVVFENAASELELWSKSASNQVEVQLRERRKGFKRRREALERIQSAAGELEQRIAEVEAQDERIAELHRRVDETAARTIAQAGDGLHVPLRLDAA